MRPPMLILWGTDAKLIIKNFMKERNNNLKVWRREKRNHVHMIYICVILDYMTSAHSTHYNTHKSTISPHKITHTRFLLIQETITMYIYQSCILSYQHCIQWFLHTFAKTVFTLSDWIYTQWPVHKSASCCLCHTLYSEHLVILA